MSNAKSASGLGANGKQSPAISGDRPVRDPADDRLGHAGFAKHVAHGVMRGCPADGLVVGLNGAWGSGKSTVLNFILHYMETDPDAEAPLVVRFNPWWFAGQDELVRRFFQQFEASIFKSRARRRGWLKKVSEFGAAVEELGIPYAEKAGKIAKDAIDGSERDVVGLKTQLCEALAKEPLRIVVIIDDIDRLSAEEIRQLFQVVKAVADFPNVIYLLAFDHQAVAQALDSSDPARGAAYLEKIIQVPFAVPPVDRLQLQTLLFKKLDQVIAGTSAELFDQQRWGNVFVDGIDPLIQKPRDIVRLVNALSVTYPAVVGEVDPVDFIAIESLRVFAPRAYDAVATNPGMFTGSGREMSRGGSRDDERAFHDAWLKSLDKDGPVVKSLLERLFPRLQSVWGNNVFGADSEREWTRSLRVASPDIFPTFFRLATPEGSVSASLVRDVVANASDSKKTSEVLLALAKEKRSDGHTRASSLLERLSDAAKSQLNEEDIRPLLVSLFTVGDEVIREGRRSALPFELGDDYRLLWVIHALLERLPLTNRCSILAELFRTGRALVLIVREFAFLGHQHGRWDGKPAENGKHLLRPQDLDVLQPIVLQRVRSADGDGTLWSAPRPLTLLNAWCTFGDEHEMRAAIASRIQADAPLIEFICWFATIVRSSGMSDRVAKVTVTLDPDAVGKYADVDAIAPRFEKISKHGGLAPDEQAALSAFHKGLTARRSNKDPFDE